MPNDTVFCIHLEIKPILALITLVYVHIINSSSIFFLSPDKQKNKALGIATGKSTELHVILTKHRFPERFPQRQLSSYKPQATCQRLLCKIVTHHDHFFLHVLKEALRVTHRDGFKSVIVERNLFCSF